MDEDDEQWLDYQGNAVGATMVPDDKGTHSCGSIGVSRAIIVAGLGITLGRSSSRVNQ